MIYFREISRKNASKNAPKIAQNVDRSHPLTVLIILDVRRHFGTRARKARASIVLRVDARRARHGDPRRRRRWRRRPARREQARDEKAAQATATMRRQAREARRGEAAQSRRRGVVPARARPEPTRRAAILQGGQLGRRGPRRGANALRTLQGLPAEGSHRVRRVVVVVVVTVFVGCKTRRTPERERVLAAEIRSAIRFRNRGRFARADLRRHPGRPRAARAVAARARRFATR